MNRSLTKKRVLILCTGCCMTQETALGKAKGSGSLFDRQEENEKVDESAEEAVLWGIINGKRVSQWVRNGVGFIFPECRRENKRFWDE